MNPKLLIPKELRLFYQLLKRFLKDWKSGSFLLFSTRRNVSVDFPFSKKMIQPFGKSKQVNSKIHNLKIASKHINQVVIRSGEIFSFWKIIGQPNRRNGYQKGRNLLNGKLVSDYGGGLCQLSGALYFLALKFGIEIIERHNHSRDIYTESERYTPLGSDATVVFGYKDLRLKNCFDFALKFDIEIAENQLICRLKSEEELLENNIEFVRNYSTEIVEVKTIINGQQAENSIYKLLL